MDGSTSYLFRYGLLTPAIFGVSHLMNRTHALTSPITVTIKHILAAPVKLNFRRLTMYAPETRNTNKGYFKAAQKYEGYLIFAS